MPDRAARRDAIVDVNNMDIEEEFDDYESEEDYDTVDEPSGALVVVSSPQRSPSPMTENNDVGSPKRKQRKTEKPAMSDVDMNAEVDVGVDPDEGARRRRRR
jgi:hypothetical protein